jgi:hypothetical protein
LLCRCGDRYEPANICRGGLSIHATAFQAGFATAFQAGFTSTLSFEPEFAMRVLVKRFQGTLLGVLMRGLVNRMVHFMLLLFLVARSTKG